MQGRLFDDNTTTFLYLPYKTHTSLFDMLLGPAFAGPVFALPCFLYKIADYGRGCFLRIYWIRPAGKFTSMKRRRLLLVLFMMLPAL